MFEESFALTPGAGRELAFVLDLSNGASGHWADIRSFTGKLIESIPGGCTRPVYCLGSAKPITGFSFLRDAEPWRRQNLGRGRVIGPVCEAIPTRPTALLVMATGRILDLEDWLDSPALQVTTFVRFGEAELTAGTRSESPPQFDRVRLWLDNPIVRVDVRAPETIPVWWDNDAYRWADGGLVAEATLEYAVRIRVVSGKTGSAKAQATLADGSRVPLTLEPLAPESSLRAWAKLTESEAEVVHQCLAGDTFRCPHGNDHTHPRRETRCTKIGGILGSPVFPSLENAKGRGFVLLSHGPDGEVHCCLHRDSGLRIGPYAVAVRDGGQARLFRFDTAAGSWQATGEFLEAYRAVGERTYAIIL